MLWIGAVFGALFGWIGILVAALFWATLAVFKLLWALALVAFQLTLAVGSLIYQALIWLLKRTFQRMANPAPTPLARATEGKPDGRKPKRKRVQRND